MALLVVGSCESDEAVIEIQRLGGTGETDEIVHSVVEESLVDIDNAFVIVDVG